MCLSDGEGLGPGALNHNQPGAPVKGRYVVSSMANHGEPNAPKIIYVRGIVDGNQTPDGRILGEQDYAPGYDITKYMSCFGPEGKSWSDQTFDYCKSIRHSGRRAATP